MSSGENASQPKPHIVVLGGGPAGLAVARQLLRRPGWKSSVTILEQADRVGGIAGSFEEHGIRLDYGSHRLHPATSPVIMADIRALLGDDLLRRPRNGRIRLMNRFVKFPLNPLNLALRLPPSFIFGVMRDSLTKLFTNKQPAVTFAEALMKGLGPTVCRRFYFPYARKLWGLDPEDLAIEQAQKRVSANNLSKIVRKVLSLVPGLKPPDAGIFYYPRKGFGQIADALAHSVRDLGGDVRLNASVRRIVRRENGTFRVECEGTGKPIEADRIFSSIPIQRLAGLLDPAAPEEVITAACHLRSRGMVFLYLVLRQPQFTPYDAHYFPEAELLASRMSEPKNYCVAATPEDKTILCYEIPCTKDDDIWNASAETLRDRVLNDMTTVGLPITTPEECFVRKHPGVYPVYDKGFAGNFTTVDRYLSGINGLISLGRQGLFAHDNTHHTMETGYRAAECLDDTLHWDAPRWARYRKDFEAHVVED